jgi:hypothetical protein
VRVALRPRRLPDISGWFPGRRLYDNQGHPVAPVVRAEFPAVNIQ